MPRKRRRAELSCKEQSERLDGREAAARQVYQRLLFEELEESCATAQLAKAAPDLAVCEEPQASTASDPARALTEHLMEEVIQREQPEPSLRG